MQFTRRHFLALSAAAAGGAVMLRRPWERSTLIVPSPTVSVPSATTPIAAQDGLLEHSLTAQRSRLTLLEGTGNTTVNTTINTLAYNGIATGDRLELRPGDTLRLTLNNQLDEPTNLHFHGLHIPPTGTGDDVFRHVAPGETYTYEFQLAPDHPATLAYYHPHHHGLVARQIFGGLGGAIIVRGELDEIPAIKAATETIAILKDFDRDFTRSPKGQEHLKGRHGEFVTLNGQQNPTWTIPQNGLLRLRLLNASTARYYQLAIEDHPLYLIGTDGGAIEQPVELEAIDLAPGERADILVKGNQPAKSYRVLDFGSGLTSGMGPGMGGMHGSNRTGQGDREPLTIATLTYGEPIATSIPNALPAQLTTIAALPEPKTIHRITLGHGMTGNSMVFLLNGQQFDHDRVDIQTQVGQVEDWEITNHGMTSHPFHIHVNPFQVIDRNGTPKPFRAWKDTVNINPGEVVRLRTRYNDFAGKTVFHCHILDHEDSGMMGILAIDTGASSA